MTLRSPLVIISGRTQELPAGDGLTSASLNWGIVKRSVDAGETMTIPLGYQAGPFVGPFKNSGTIKNSGVLVVGI